MNLVFYVISYLAMIAMACIVFRFFVHRDYQRFARLTWFSSLLELLVWGLYIAFPYLYNPPDWAVVWTAEVPVSPAVRLVGLVLITLGLALAFGTMAWFGLRRAFGLATTRLVQDGPYRLTRNPQVVGGFPMVIGTVLLFPSWYAAGWALLFGVIAHMMVITEEGHLLKVFGEEYVRYCARTPRYLNFKPVELKVK